MVELPGASRGQVRPQNIREAGSSDIPFILALARRKYGNFNSDLAAKWLETALGNAAILVLRGNHSVGISYVQSLFYWQKPRGHILFSFSQPRGLSREMLLIFQKLTEWLKDKGCFEVVMGSEIGTDYAPFAKIMGAVECPHYVIRFEKPCLRS